MESHYWWEELLEGDKPNNPTLDDICVVAALGCYKQWDKICGIGARCEYFGMWLALGLSLESLKIAR